VTPFVAPDRQQGQELVRVFDSQFKAGSSDGCIDCGEASAGAILAA
jgi:hypothetical protein